MTERCALSIRAADHIDPSQLVHGILMAESGTPDPLLVFAGDDGMDLVVRRDAIVEVARVKAGPGLAVDVTYADETGTTRTAHFVGAVERLAPLFAVFGMPVVPPHTPTVRRAVDGSDRGAPGRRRSRTPAPYASWGRRVVAWSADAAIVGTLYLLACAGLQVGAKGSSGSGLATTFDILIGYAKPSPLGTAIYLVLTLGAVGFWAWNTMVRQGRTGYTLGKQWSGVRLVREDTREVPGVMLAFVRTIVHGLDSMPCYLGWLWPLWHGKRQTFADMIVGTVVVVQRRVPDPDGG